MSDQVDMFDICDICASRHRGNEQSREANPTAISKQRDRERVFELISLGRGLTSKDVAEIMEKPLNCISGRISELKKQQRIAVNGSRDGCGILVAR